MVVFIVITMMTLLTANNYKIKMVALSTIDLASHVIESKETSCGMQTDKVNYYVLCVFCVSAGQ